MEKLHKEEFDQWRMDETTKKVYAALREARQRQEERLAYGSTIGVTVDETAQNTNRLVGIIQGIDLFLEMQVE